MIPARYPASEEMLEEGEILEEVPQLIAGEDSEEVEGVEESGKAGGSEGVDDELAV